ncbi:MAG: HDOD domain-containing protein [Candidatus Sedimenticola sp. (ex Thyasira tokunagai)]
MISELEFQGALQNAISEDRIILPTLPEVALQVRDAVESEDTTAVQVAELVATDAALSARLLQVANSPLYRGRSPIDSIQVAITRLGNKLVRSLVVSLAMKQIFQATSDTLDRRLRANWAQSVQIAAISRVLAQPLPQLDRDQAMLAGLIHNIGSLPILIMSETYPQLIENDSRLDYFVDQLSPVIGKQILEAWDFPNSLVQVAEHYKDFAYDGSIDSDYVDVVLVARLQALDIHQLEEIDITQVPSFAKVGLEPEVEIVTIEGVAEDLAEVEEILL